jgi:hypothetical protein
MRFAVLCFLAVCLHVAACANGQPGPNAPNGTDAGDDPDRGDGSTGDGPADAAVPVTCGGSICRSDQTCEAGRCTFACAGYTVPGDYATIGAAIDALAATGADATICLADQSYSEPTIYIRDPGQHGKALRIVGPAMDRATINADFSVQTGWGSVTFKGVHVAAGTNRTAITSSGAATVEVIATKLSGYNGVYAYQRHDLTLDGCEIVPHSGYGVGAYASSSGPLKVIVRNSYFHATAGAYAVRAQTQSPYAIELTFVNNTVVGLDVGLELSAITTATIANNLFTGATTHAMSWLSGTTVTRHHNALWGNVTNYAGLASDGESTIKTDCMLDLATRVPSLRAGSPCRDAGDASTAPPADFYGAARAMPPDLGAVEAP